MAEPIPEKPIPLDPKKVKFIIVHHSATPRDKTTFESIKKYHVEVRKFWDIGYHWVILGDSTLKQGRSEEYIGAHAKGVNFESVGVCVVGNFEIEQPTRQQLETLELVLNQLMRKYNVSPVNVLGHRDVANTLCPGKNLYEWLKDWKKRQILNNSNYLDEIINLLKEVLKRLEELRKIT